MGRAERRKTERANRIENRKGKLVVSKQELSDIRKNVSNEVSERNVNTLMTCFGVSLHRVYGFGGRRIMRVLQYIDYMMSDLVDGTYTIDDYREWLLDETGVSIK